jgi:PKD repeat protein
LLAQAPTAAAPNQPPTAVATMSCDGMVCTGDAAGSTDADGTIAAYAWDFGDGATAAGARASHQYPVAGTYTVTLRVTDNGGATGSTARTVTPSAAAVGFLAAARTNANATSFTVTVPATVGAGDALLLFLTGNSAATVSEPSGTGWAPIGSVNGTDLVGRGWRKVATASDAGQTVTITSSALLKADVTLLAYRGTSATAPVAAAAVGSETISRAGHTTPAVTVPAGAGWLVSYWADKSSATTTWTVPDGVTSRGVSAGAGGGRVTSLSGDSLVPAGSAGALTATATTGAADSASAKAVMFSVVLTPA